MRATILPLDQINLVPLKVVIVLAWTYFWELIMTYDTIQLFFGLIALLLSNQSDCTIHIVSMVTDDVTIQISLHMTLAWY